MKEAFDYIGSGRMVYDMEHRNFPLDYGHHLSEISLHHIDSIVEVNQLAHTDEGKLWIHSDPVSGSNASIATEVSISKTVPLTLAEFAKITLKFRKNHLSVMLL